MVEDLQRLIGHLASAVILKDGAYVLIAGNANMKNVYADINGDKAVIIKGLAFALEKMLPLLSDDSFDEAKTLFISIIAADDKRRKEKAR